MDHSNDGNKCGLAEVSYYVGQGEKKKENNRRNFTEDIKIISRFFCQHGQSNPPSNVKKNHKPFVPSCAETGLN